MNADLDRARSIARSVIAGFGIDDPSEIDVEAIAFSKGVFVREAVLAGSAARLVRSENHGVITVNSSIREDGQKRFGIAHELGHFDLHQDARQLSVCTDDMLLTYRIGTTEPEANAYASELLMPRDLFEGRMQGAPNLNQVLDLAADFRASVTAAAFRFCDLTRERCAVVLCKDGRVSRVFTNDEFRYWIEDGIEVPADTHAADAFKGETLPEEMRPVPLRAWVDAEVPRDARVLEQALAMPYYGAALSLLWIDEPLEEEVEY